MSGWLFLVVARVCWRVAWFILVIAMMFLLVARLI